MSGGAALLAPTPAVLTVEAASRFLRGGGSGAASSSSASSSALASTSSVVNANQLHGTTADSPHILTTLAGPADDLAVARAIFAATHLHIPQRAVLLVEWLCVALQRSAASAGDGHYPEQSQEELGAAQLPSPPMPAFLDREYWQFLLQVLRAVASDSRQRQATARLSIVPAMSAVLRAAATLGQPKGCPLADADDLALLLSAVAESFAACYLARSGGAISALFARPALEQEVNLVRDAVISFLELWPRFGTTRPLETAEITLLRRLMDSLGVSLRVASNNRKAYNAVITKLLAPMLRLETLLAGACRSCQREEDARSYAELERSVAGLLNISLFHREHIPEYLSVIRSFFLEESKPAGKGALLSYPKTFFDNLSEEGRADMKVTYPTLFRGFVDARRRVSKAQDSHTEFSADFEFFKTLFDIVCGRLEIDAIPEEDVRFLMRVQASMLECFAVSDTYRATQDEVSKRQVSDCLDVFATRLRWEDSTATPRKKRADSAQPRVDTDGECRPAVSPQTIITLTLLSHFIDGVSISSEDNKAVEAFGPKIWTSFFLPAFDFISCGLDANSPNPDGRTGSSLAKRKREDGGGISEALRIKMFLEILNCWRALALSFLNFNARCVTPDFMDRTMRLTSGVWVKCNDVAIAEVKSASRFVT
ncbi:hypothetical protein HK405_005638 [Cladochytrium tenue]|nr:hypothetical protein HK405_005638 [Cladochytrium tenue]